MNLPPISPGRAELNPHNLNTTDVFYQSPSKLQQFFMISPDLFFIVYSTTAHTAPIQSSPTGQSLISATYSGSILQAPRVTTIMQPWKHLNNN
jgi:hypothetical protein